MRLRITVTLVFVASLLLAVAGSACLGGDNGDGEASEAMLDMMKRVPEGAAMFMFYDVGEMRGYGEWEDLLKGTELPDSGIEPEMDEVDAMAMAMPAMPGGESMDYLMLMEGSFDSGDLADELDTVGWDNATYSGVDIWVMEAFGGFSMAMALWDDLLAAGTEDMVKDCIDVIEGGEDSLYDNDDFRDVADRLGSGLIAMVTEVEAMGEIGMEDAEILGMSYDRKDSDTAKIKAAVVFADEDAADAAVDDIERLPEEEGWENINIEQSGRIIEASGEIDMDDLVLFGD
jgi:hypothetical protein